MSSPNKEVDFKEIAVKIHQNYAEDERNIKKLCQKTSLISLADFYDGYQREVKEINSVITPSKDRPTIADFADIFITFEEYPANIQKPKKATPKEHQLTRMNSTMLKGSTTSLASDAPAPKDSSNSSINLSLPPLAECATATQTYSDFKQFQQKLIKLNAEGREELFAQDYATKLRQLSTFAQQLEKLLPTHCVGTPAFSSEEEATLQRLETELSELDFIQHNQDVFQNASSTGGGDGDARLENLVEVLSYALMAVNNFNGRQH